jgi:hypothetical protein
MELRRGGIRPGVAPHAEEVGEGRRGSTAVGGARSIGNCPRPVGAGGVARPCRVAGSSRGGRWLTGGPGATVTAAGVKQFKSFPNSNCSKQFQTFPNSG